MEISTIIPHLEAIVFASDKPVTTIDLVELLNNAMGFMEDRATLDQVESALDAIREKYNSEFYPFHVVQSGGGWQFLTKKEFHATVGQLNGQKFMKKLSTAALEVLSIIAYKQPITKGEIEDIRGVNSDYAVQKLLEKELVIITGRKENAPGQPLIYATSKNFMDYFGINSAADLPQLSDVASQEIVNPTQVGLSAQMVDADMPEGDENEALAINDQGEIVVTSNNQIDEVTENIIETINEAVQASDEEVIDEAEADDIKESVEDDAIVDELDITEDSENADEENLDEEVLDIEVFEDDENNETIEDLEEDLEVSEDEDAEDVDTHDLSKGDKQDEDDADLDSEEKIN